MSAAAAGARPARAPAPARAPGPPPRLRERLRRALAARLGRRGRVPLPLPTAILQLALPGGTSFSGRIDAAGCRPLGADDGPGPGERLLTCDDRDVRIARATAPTRAEAVELAADLNPDVEYRLVFVPGQPVFYARPRDELPPGGDATPLLLVLELLARAGSGAAPVDPARPAPPPRDVLTVVLGAAERPDLVLMVGRDADGELDPDTLQAWLRPQDPVEVLRHDFLDRGLYAYERGGAAAAAGPVLGAVDLLAAAARAPAYVRAGQFLGRTGAQWSTLAALGFGGTALAGALAAALCALDLRAADAALARAQAADRDARAALAATATADLAALARAASLDPHALVQAAREVWAEGARVRIDARAAGVTLVASRGVGAASPRAADPAAAVPASPADPAADPRAVAALLARPVPAGYLRGPVALSADGRTLSVNYVATPHRHRAAAARLLAR